MSKNLSDRASYVLRLVYDLQFRGRPAVVFPYRPAVIFRRREPGEPLAERVVGITHYDPVPAVVVAVEAFLEYLATFPETPDAWWCESCGFRQRQSPADLTTYRELETRNLIECCLWAPTVSTGRLPPAMLRDVRYSAHGSPSGGTVLVRTARVNDSTTVRILHRPSTEAAARFGTEHRFYRFTSTAVLQESEGLPAMRMTAAGCALLDSRDPRPVAAQSSLTGPNQVVRDHIRRQMASGVVVANLTRDGIARATGLSAGAVSDTPAWKSTAALKRQAKTPAEPDAQVLKAAKQGDWTTVEQLQSQEERRQRKAR